MTTKSKKITSRICHHRKNDFSSENDLISNISLKIAYLRWAIIMKYALILKTLASE